MVSSHVYQRGRGRRSALRDDFIAIGEREWWVDSSTKCLSVCVCVCMCICFSHWRWRREEEEKKTCFTIQLVTKSSWVLEYLMSDLLPLFLKGIRRHLFALTICLSLFLSLSRISRIHSVWVREETLFNWVAVALVNELPVTLAVVKWIINLSSSTLALCTQVIQQAFRYERDYFPPLLSVSRSCSFSVRVDSALKFIADTLKTSRVLVHWRWVNKSLCFTSRQFYTWPILFSPSLVAGETHCHLFCFSFFFFFQLAAPDSP